jgi:hypothetical protein
LVDLFTDEFRESHTLTYLDSSNEGDQQPNNNLTEQEEAALAEMLRSLGYVN